MRIGDLAARTGASVHLLRVWEQRYDLLAPGRSTGGYRLYGPQDELRVREMLRLRDQGMPTGRAAATALSVARAAIPPPGGEAATGNAAVGAVDVATVRERLLEACAGFDGASAHRQLDTAIEHLGVESTLGAVVLPVLHEAGQRWASGDLSIAQEHFMSHLLRGRLGAMALTWDVGNGPVAVLACPTGELHDLGLYAFGVVLGRSGWRVHYLGADTPLETLATAVHALNPRLVVLSATRADALLGAAEEIDQLAESDVRAMRTAHVVVAGAGATEEVGSRLGATVLTCDPVTAARMLADRLREPATSG